jgi:hypothetical protein
MQAINLTDTDGNVIIDALFATSLSELPLANYCDYLPILEEYVSFVAEIDDTKLSIGNQFKSISIMAKAVAAWLDINVDNVMQLQLNESYDSESFNTCPSNFIHQYR